MIISIVTCRRGNEYNIHTLRRYDYVTMDLKSYDDIDMCYGYKFVITRYTHNTGLSAFY